MPEKRLPAVSPGTGLGPDQRVLGFREDGLPMKENPLLELRAGAEKTRFHIPLASEYDRIGRIPVECSTTRPFLSVRCGQ